MTILLLADTNERSTSKTNKTIWVASVNSVDKNIGSKCKGERNWRLKEWVEYGTIEAALVKKPVTTPACRKRFQLKLTQTQNNFTMILYKYDTRSTGSTNSTASANAIGVIIIVIWHICNIIIDNKPYTAITYPF